MAPLLVIATGGTIDSAYPADRPTPQYVPTPRDSAIPAALGRLGLREGQDYRFVRLCHHDSNHVASREMQSVLTILEQHPEADQVVITHGTDTAPRNGRYLTELLSYASESHRKVVFCGAMKPLRSAAIGIDGARRNEFREPADTDGWESLDTALQAAKFAPPGVYLADGRQLHSVSEIDKSRIVAHHAAGNTISHAEFVGRLAGVHPDRDLLTGW